MSQHHQNAAVSARVQHIHALHLFLVNYRDPEIGKDEHQGPPKLCWRYTLDGKRMLVQLNNTTHHAAIILKMAVPKRVGQHDIRSAVLAMFVGTVEETAKIWLNAQCVEVVPGHFQDPGAGWIVARV